MRYIFLFFILGIGILVSPSLLHKKTFSKQDISRIISLTPSDTKTLDYLGLGQYIIGISTLDTNQKYQDLPKIGGGISINVEEVLTLNPDLVTITKTHLDYIPFFEQHNIRTIILSNNSLDDITIAMKELQKIFPKIDLSQKIEKYVDDLNTLRNEKIQNYKKILFILSIDPVYSFSTNTYLHEFFLLMGWEHIVKTSSPYPILSEEDILKYKEVDLLVSSPHLHLEDLKTLPINSKEIIILSNSEWQFPSPYLLEDIKKLR